MAVAKFTKSVAESAPRVSEGVPEVLWHAD